ncbi:hypothetical protein Tco_0280501 [Tanacetum coccineum]
MARIKEQVKDQLPQILPKEVSNFAPPVIKKSIKESRDEVTLAKVSSQPHSTYEAASTLTEFELKKILLDKMEKSESYMAAPEHRDCYDSLKKKDSTSDSSKGTKSQPKSSGKSVQSEEPVFEVADSDMPQDQKGNLGNNDDEPRKETASRSDWFKKSTPPQDPTDPDWHVGKTIQEGPPQKWLMTLVASTPTDKSLKDFDELMSTPIDFSSYICLWGILHWRQQRKSFYAYARGIQSRGDVYSTKRIMTVTHVKVMRKHGYGYLEEIVVRRANNVLYRFKEVGYSRSRVEDHQLGSESYQKKINVTKPDTTRPDLRKRHPYTPYKDPQGFIYVDDYKRNRLMRSDELYKFSDGTLTRLLSSLEDITKNIDMTYLPKRRWSNLEKKRAHFMIKDINKLLKERRMMRSLEKFVGGRLYRTDLRLLQRTI